MNNMAKHVLAQAFGRLDKSVTKLESHLTIFMELIMSDIQALESKIAELRDAVSAHEAADAALVDRLNAKVAELQAALDAAQPVDTQSMIDELEAIKLSLGPVAPAAPAADPASEPSA